VNKEWTSEFIRTTLTEYYDGVITDQPDRAPVAEDAIVPWVRPATVVAAGDNGWTFGKLYAPPAQSAAACVSLMQQACNDYMQARLDPFYAKLRQLDLDDPEDKETADFLQANLQQCAALFDEVESSPWPHDAALIEVMQPYPLEGRKLDAKSMNSRWPNKAPHPPAHAIRMLIHTTHARTNHPHTHTHT
jgi:hypothetical protein